MNIKTPFKCYWRERPETIYTFNNKTDTEFLCTWLDDLGREEYVNYEKESVFRQIEEGIVIVLVEDPLVTIPESEYHSLIEEINMLQELVKELSAPQDSAGSDAFKPISEYTLEDWQQAIDEDWEFECRDGDTVRIIEVDEEDVDYPVKGTDIIWRDIEGFWDTGRTDPDDIVKRIR